MLGQRRYLVRVTAVAVSTFINGNEMMRKWAFANDSTRYLRRSRGIICFGIAVDSTRKSKNVSGHGAWLLV